MIRVGLISDSHGLLPDDVIPHLEDCDEVWHGGDLGHLDIEKQMPSSVQNFRAVYGNIDNAQIRQEYPLNMEMDVNGLKVLMTHIGGYPGRYTGRVKKLLYESKPDLYICGHSHICKVMRDQDLGTLHMNPGACGHIGFHPIRTILKFEISIVGKIENLRAVELGRRGALKNS